MEFEYLSLILIMEPVGLLAGMLMQLTSLSGEISELLGAGWVDDDFLMGVKLEAAE